MSSRAWSGNVFLAMEGWDCSVQVQIPRAYHQGRAFKSPHIPVKTLGWKQVTIIQIHEHQPGELNIKSVGKIYGRMGWDFFHHICFALLRPSDLRGDGPGGQLIGSGISDWQGLKISTGHAMNISLRNDDMENLVSNPRSISITFESLQWSIEASGLG